MLYVDPKHARDALIAWIVTTYTNFLVQIAMVVFFLQLKTDFSEKTYLSTDLDAHDTVSVQSVERIEETDTFHDQFSHLKKQTESLFEDPNNIDSKS